MKHPAKIIHKERTSWEEYGNASDYVKRVAEAALNKRASLNGWSQLAIMDEAWCQTTTLLMDFSEHIYFENDYFNTILAGMPRNVANVVFSIVYLFLNDYGTYPGKLPEVQQMIASKLSGVKAKKMVMKASRRIIPLDGFTDTKNPDFLSFFPNSDYFEDAEFVDWNRFTEGFKTETVYRIMELIGEHETKKKTEVARCICGQAKAAMLEGTLTRQAFNGIKRMLSDFMFNPDVTSEESIAHTDNQDEEIARLRRLLAQEREKLAQTEEYMLSGIGQGAAQAQIAANYEARIADLKAQLAEKDKVIEELKKVPTEDAFVKKLIKATKTQFRFKRNEADAVRQVMDKLGRSDADADLTAWMEGRERKPSISIDKLEIRQGGTNIDTNYGPNIEHSGGTLSLPDKNAGGNNG